MSHLLYGVLRKFGMSLSGGQGRDSEAVHTGALGTCSDCSSYAFEKQGQFGIENTTIMR